MLVFAVSFSGINVTNAQSKALMKEVKARSKQLTKEGWKMLGGSTTLNYALTKYRMYLEEDPENRIEIVGIAPGKNVKIGRDNAMLNGITNYCARAKAQVVGKLKSVSTTDQNTEIDKFGEAYETSVNTKIGGLVKQHFSLVRENKDGTKEFNVFMSIDEKAAREARERAAEEAMQNAQLQSLSDQVRDFIGEPVSE